MKTLIVFYSRTGITKKIAEALAQKLSADIEELKDTVSRSGIRGYFSAGRDATKRILTKLEQIQKNPEDYDLIIMGTPIWSWNMSPAIRTYATEDKDKFKQVAFFCTMGGSGDKRACAELEQIIGKKTVAQLGLKTTEVNSGKFSEALEAFSTNISQNP